MIAVGSGLVIPTMRVSQSSRAALRYSRWPLWKGWKRPWTMPYSGFTGGMTLASGDDGYAPSLVNFSDAPQRQAGALKGGLGLGDGIGRYREQQPPRSLR